MYTLRNAFSWNVLDFIKILSFQFNDDSFMETRLAFWQFSQTINSLAGIIIY